MVEITPEFLSCKPALEQNLYRLNHFLKTHNEQKAAKGDLNFILEYQQQIIGSARLIKQTETVLWLRGLYIVEDYRHQGLGSKLIHDIHHHIKQTTSPPTMIFAFPYAHLHNFYSDLGYVSCVIETLPKSLQEKYRSSRAQGKTWLLMKHNL